MPGLGAEVGTLFGKAKVWMQVQVQVQVRIWVQVWLQVQEEGEVGRLQEEAGLGFV